MPKKGYVFSHQCVYLYIHPLSIIIEPFSDAFRAVFRSRQNDILWRTDISTSVVRISANVLSNWSILLSSEVHWQSPLIDPQASNTFESRPCVMLNINFSTTITSRASTLCPALTSSYSIHRCVRGVLFFDEVRFYIASSRSSSFATWWHCIRDAKIIFIIVMNSKQLWPSSQLWYHTG